MQTLTSRRPIRYEQLVKLGEGTFSTVYKALRRDSEFDLQQYVALKILKSEIAIENWRDEFAALEKVNSDKCVRVIGWDILEEKPTLVLEWVDGLTLDILGMEKEISIQLIDELCLQIFEGLTDIHSCGLVHGDMSPQNVMITKSGKIKLLDFGLSKTPIQAFTPEFAAPELLNGQIATKASDLYSLGRIREYLERRARLPLSFTTKQLLHAEPSQRRFDLVFEPLESERIFHQSLVGQIVMAACETREDLSLTPGTRMQSREVSKFFKNISLLFLTTMALGSGPAAYDAREGYLIIKTAKWHAITLDRKKLGYTPLEVSLKANRPHRLEWQAANNHGHRTLTLKPGQNMVISDEFFK